MGSETTIAGTYIGGAVILALTAQLCAIYAARLDPPQSWLDAGWAFASLAAFPCVSAVAAIGTFQLLAARYWGHARKGPLRRSDTLRSKLHSLSDSWSGHR